VILLFVCNITLKAAEYNFQNYSTSNGLSHTMVNCIIQDKLGFIWIATSDGLNRFDGYSFKKYYSKKNDSFSLDNNNINFIVEGVNGKIWIASGDGFYYLTQNTESFRKVHFNNGENNRLAEQLCVDDSGTVWGVSNNEMLIKINATTNLEGEYIKLDSLLKIDVPLFNKRIIYADNYIWVLSNIGIIKINPKNQSSEIIQSNIQFTSPRAIKKGKNGELLIVDWEMGVYSLNISTSAIIPMFNKEIANLKKNNIGITDAQWRNGTLWVSAFPGLYSINESGETQIFNTANGYNQDYDKMVFFTSMFDRDGNLWLGSQDKGVYIVSKKKNVFKHYLISLNNKKGLPASKFIVANNEILTCNVYGTFYKQGNNSFKQISQGVGIAVAAYNENEYIIFEKTQILVFNKKTFKTSIIYKTTDIQNGIVDSRGILWFTHWERGVEGYNPSTKEHYHIDVAPENKSVNVVFCMLEDTDGSLWLGTFGAGLQHVINPTNKKPTIKKYVQSKTENSLSNNFVTTLYKDSNEFVWIGTNGGGLNKFNIADETFVAYTTEDGLPGNVIQSILSDALGNIWFSTNVITKFDVQNSIFTHYDKGEGVTTEYFTLCAQKTSDGLLYFGDNNGIIYFNPEQLSTKNIVSTPLLTGVRLFGKTIEVREQVKETIPFKKSITYTDSILFPYNFNSFSFEFASINFNNNENIEYSYMLKGVDDDWVYVPSNERLAVYSGLPHGEYVFLVRASNDQKNWSEPHIVYITISPPWWKTIWFKILLTIVTVSLVFFYIQSLRKRNKSLERIVQKRTIELRQTNERLQNDQVVIEMKNKQLIETIESREKLMFTIAHDFKNPLTGILGASQLLETESKKLGVDIITKFTKSITISAKSLVNQMVSLLDWIQSEDENLKANPVDINVEILVTDAISLVQAVADKKNINIELFNNSKMNALVDLRMGSMIFRNILSNAIKYTPNGGSICVLIKELDQNIDISFSDNGIGMKPELIEKINNNDEEIESTLGTENEIGTGFGLKMIKKIIEKNNGKLSITSAERQGSVFFVSLPKGVKNIPQIEVYDNIYVERTETEKIVNDSKKTILVIDDDEQTLHTIKALLENMYDVILANSGYIGLSISTKQIPDLIICDINIGDISGIDLCSQIKKNKKTIHIPVIMVSSYQKNSIKDDAFNAGANDYIEKPFNTFHLMKKVESIFILKERINEKVKNEIASEVFPDMEDSYESDFVKKVNDFINENLKTENLNTNIVAKKLGVNRTQLWRVYKKETGLTLGDFIKEKKIQKATAMLLTEKYRIAEIADEVGFADARYFSKWFAKERGMTPTKFVEKMKKEKL